MEFTEKTLRKFLLEALNQTVMPQLESIRDELKGDISGVRDELKGDISGVRDELKGDISGVKVDMSSMRDELKKDISGVRDELKGDISGVKVDISEIKRELLNLEEKIFPEFAEIREDFKIILKEMEKLQIGGDAKKTFHEIKSLEGLIARLKQELNDAVKRINNFEIDIRKLKQYQNEKCKIAK